MTENTAEARPLPHTLPEYQGFTRQMQEVIKHFTGYKVWTSDAGSLYATRVRDLTVPEREAGLAQTIAADKPLALADAITEQMRMASEVAASS
ncbi:hypothetical protein BJF79_30665 [Actinomadura sp. CNU-125]|uniref:hypothetical protein n=1 Tax=Actinomadura sp. CNU-125 TaxID=1904961 RepID=UPI000963C261|nr:hypothetical protein [Actinomadura sp. CNU-125]OLT36736.1 hypothetical protein BJF79_30665 [Actinomadura sp. CNU-125]